MVDAKVYVGVKAEFREDGVMQPRRIVWEDGREFVIDRIKDIRQAAAGQMTGTIRESVNAKTHVRLWERDHLLFDLQSPYAAYEYVPNV